MPISLRALEPEDLELVYAIENDQALWSWGCNSVPLSRYTVRQYLQEQQGDIYKDGQVRLVIEAEGVAVGIVDLSSFEPRHLRAEVGIVLCSPYQSKGYATAALTELHHYAKENLHLSTLYAYVSEQNPRAQALFRRLGYTEVASLSRWIEGRETATMFQILL